MCWGLRHRGLPSPVAGSHTLVTDDLAGSEAFAQPLGPACTPECMLLDPELVTRTARRRHMSVDRRGYLRVTLANISGGRGGGKKRRKVNEWAHRLVTWAMYGPPPAGLKCPEVMHVCDPATGEGNPRCLNPQHAHTRCGYGLARWGAAAGVGAPAAAACGAPVF